MFRGIFLTSANPAHIAKFYQDLAGLQFQQIDLSGYTYWKIDDGKLQIAIHDAESFSDYTHPVNPDSNLTHLYFKIVDRQVFLQKLQALKLTPFRTDDIVITVVDPDGRKVMFGTA